MNKKTLVVGILIVSACMFLALSECGQTGSPVDVEHILKALLCDRSQHPIGNWIFTATGIHIQLFYYLVAGIIVAIIGGLWPAKATINQSRDPVMIDPQPQIFMEESVVESASNIDPTTDRSKENLFFCGIVGKFTAKNELRCLSKCSCPVCRINDEGGI